MLLDTPTITVSTHGGMGNRLFGIISAIRLIQKGHFSKLGIIWTPGIDCGAPFEALFHVAVPYTVNKSDPEALFIDHKSRLTRTIPLAPHLTVRTCYRFLCDADNPNHWHEEEFSQAARQLRPLPDLLKLADVHDVFGLLGVHCRRTDYRPHVQHRYDELDQLFAGYVADTFGDCGNFLATDSPRTEENFRHYFSNVSVYPKSHFPNGMHRNFASVREAVVDMVLLSRCRSVLADSHSTFAAVAGWLGQGTAVWAPPADFL